MRLASADVATSIAAQAKEIAAAADLYVRMPKLRRGLQAALGQQITNLAVSWNLFLGQGDQENGPEK